jgi:hypothetical protein
LLLLLLLQPLEVTCEKKKMLHSWS